jgi:FMN phosphatase YigB (HAD superfamily)
LIDELRDVFSTKGSLEYSFTVQELPSVRSKPPEEVERLVTLAKKVFGRVRSATLQLYDGVKDTLAWAQQEGIVVVGVTNAPIDHVERRLKSLYLDGLLYGLCGREGHGIPRDFAWTEEIWQKSQSGRYRSRIRHLWPIDEKDLKPSPIPYMTIMAAVRAAPQTTYVVGDSLAKDLAPGVHLGLTTIWAEYGQKIDPKNSDTLFRVTHWGPDQIRTAYGPAVIEPSFRIKSFSEIRRIIKPQQAYLF